MNIYDAILTIEVPSKMGIYSESDCLTSSTEVYIDKVLSAARDTNTIIAYANGASQLAFIIEGADRVIKIPFDGIMNEWEDWNPDTEEENYKEEFEPFDLDYTAKTYDIYQLAVEAGVSEFFADIDILGLSFNNQLIYTQKFVLPLGEDGSSSIDPSEDSLRKAKEMCRNRRIPFDYDWVATCLDLYGEEKFNQLLEFINEHRLNDFHSNNYGYTRDGKPMLLDYCGF